MLLPRLRHRAALIRPLLLGLLVAALLVLLLAVFFMHRPAPPPTASRPATTRATTLAAATKPLPPYIPKTIYDVLKHDVPTLATTQPFEIPLELRDAAHLVLRGPVYFDRRRLDLWITRPEAAPTPSVLRSAGDEQTHVVRERVLFVHWQGDDSGNFFPYLVVAAPNSPLLILPSGQRLALPAGSYDWPRAISLNNQIIVPTPTGVALLQINSNSVSASTHDLPGLHSAATQPGDATTQPSDVAASPVQLLLDWRGVLAFAPADLPGSGSRGAARYVDGHWLDLTPDAGWPDKIIHLIPLLDGSVLCICPADKPGRVDLRMLTLDTPEVDSPAVTKLVAQMSDPNPQSRQAAFDQLTRYGPTIFPLLEKLLPDQPPEARIRLTQLLRNKLKPSLGNMTVVDGKLKVVSRYPDGSALFYADAGVSLPSADGTLSMVSPAWIIVRPGMPIRLAPDQLVRDLKPDSARLRPFLNEWVSLDDSLGPCRFFGNDLVPLLKGPERKYSDFVGIDRRGRWLFAQPGTSAGDSHQSLLLLDPTFADPTPRLPVWTLLIRGGSAGSDRQGYPAIKSGGAFSLVDGNWKPLKEEEFFPADSPPPQPAPATTTATTLPTTAPSTTASTTQPAALLITADGTRYRGGTDSLIIEPRTGPPSTVPLPPELSGTLPPVLLEAEGKLFLFNQPGKVVRLTPTGKVEAVFTRNIPNEAPDRVWKDPAGRICIVTSGNRLSILFPAGRIPQEIANKMPQDQLDDAANGAE